MKDIYTLLGGLAVETTTVIELRSDSQFCSHEFMDWPHNQWYIRYMMGSSGNSMLLSMVNKPSRSCGMQSHTASEL